MTSFSTNALGSWRHTITTSNDTDVLVDYDEGIEINSRWLAQAHLLNNIMLQINKI